MKKKKRIKNKDEFNEVLNILNDKTKIEISIISSILSKFKIRRLLTCNIDSKPLYEEKEKLENNLNNLFEFVLDKYNQNEILRKDQL